MRRMLAAPAPHVETVWTVDERMVASRISQTGGNRTGLRLGVFTTIAGHLQLG